MKIQINYSTNKMTVQSNATLIFVELNWQKYSFITSVDVKYVFP